MSRIKDIITLCKAGQLTEAYERAQTDLQATPSDVWAQREVGWALYYMLKAAAHSCNKQAFFAHLEEFAKLDALTTQDKLLFESILWAMGNFIRQLPKTQFEDIQRLFSQLGSYTFTPSKAYSFLLKAFLGFKQWSGLAAFIEWWNLDNLLPEDYQPFLTAHGNSIMSLAEQAYIAYSKALLMMNDKNKTSQFIPKLEKLIDNYPDMTYPGYFCGKLMLSMGAAQEEALQMVMPFARKKQKDFWVWQLLGDVYKNEPDTRLACYLRATHCKAKEDFLGKVRLKLASIYYSRKDYNRAKFQLDTFVTNYKQNGWNIPAEAWSYAQDPLIQHAVADKSDGINYNQVTRPILYLGANESIAVAAYVNAAQKYGIIVYGERMRAKVKLSQFHLPVQEGQLIKLYWLPSKVKDGNITILGAETVDSADFSDNPYLKKIEGKIEKQAYNPFAFIKGKGIRCFISPSLVSKYQLAGNEKVAALALLNYNKKKAEWAWSCVSLEIKD